MRLFDHIGIPSVQQRPGEMYVPETRVWVTDPQADPQRIEYLRFEPDSPVASPLRDQPHVAFRVDDLDREMAGCQILLGPFYATETLRVVFVQKDGAILEFMYSPDSGHWFVAGDR